MLTFVKDTDAAWLAGIFEGEGTISIFPPKNVQVVISMTDRDIIERINTLFPCVAIRTRQIRADWQLQYLWKLSNAKQIREFIALVQPWLGVRRSAKALEALAMLDSRKGHIKVTHCVRGHEFTPENTYRYPAPQTRRACRECKRVREQEASRKSRERKGAQP